MPTDTEYLNPPETKYQIRYTSETLIINGNPIDYGDQILDLDKLYIISAGPNNSLKTPIVLDRTEIVDELDRKIFTRNFLYEIVKAIEISSFDDAAFIFQRVPKLLKYFVGIIQRISLVRWVQLLQNDIFFLVLYDTLDQLISKKCLSNLRADYIEEILQTHLKTTYSRIYFLMDNLVLENQNLRNSIVNLARQIVVKEFDTHNFFEIYLIGKSQTNLQDEDSQNSAIQDNLSDTDSVPEDKEMNFPEKFLSNTIGVLKSCQKIKIPKETITAKILNGRFFKLLKHFFEMLFQRQRYQLLELLALASQIQPNKLWKITFEEGRSIRCKSLLYLESILTNAMISYSEVLKRPTRAKKLTSQKNTQQIQKEEIANCELNKCWEFTSVIIEKFILIQSPERKVFLHKILNTLLACRLIHEELDFVLMFLENTSKDEVYLKKNSEIWKMIVRKIENWLLGLISSQCKKNVETNSVRSKKKTKKCQNKTFIPDSGNESSLIDIICQEDETFSSFTLSQHKNRHSSLLKLPMSKASIIKLMKIYRVLVTNQKKFGIELDSKCLIYLIDATERRKGAIQGAKMALIEVLGKQESFIGDNFDICEETNHFEIDL